MKKSLSLFMVFTMVLTMFGGFSIVASAEVPEGYTEINSTTDFETTIEANPSGKYYLTEDIVLPDDYVPIASFSGELTSDENAPKSITMNITMPVTAATNIGLFAKVTSAVRIENIILKGSITVSGTADKVYVGALFGLSDDSTVNTGMTINNIRNEVNITIGNGVGGEMGGIAGRIYNGKSSGYPDITFTNLVNTGNITQIGTSKTPSISGIAAVSQANLYNCENYGNITTDSGHAAGICYEMRYAASISHCYNAGTIKGGDKASTERYVGGIVFYRPSKGDKVIEECYNIGAVTVGTGVAAFQIALGKDDPTGCFYLEGVAGRGENAEALTLTEMQTALEGTASDEFMAALDAKQYGDYTPIASDTDFEKIRLNPSGKYYLTEDIVLPSTYEPIASFSGELISDENAPKSITLNINREVSAATNIGLFAKVTSAVRIENIILKGSITVSGTGTISDVYVGALFGLADGTDASTAMKINNIRNEVNITIGNGVGGQMGGIAGKIDGSNTYRNVTLTNLVNKGNITQNGVSAAPAIGGIAGRSQANLYNCENYGDITTDIGNAAGICQNMAAATSISHCYNAGTIKAAIKASSAVRYAGGIIFDRPAQGEAVIEECYNIGAVTVGGKGYAFHIATNGNDLIPTGYYLEGVEGRGSNAISKTLAEMRALSDLPADFKVELNNLRKVTISSADEEMGTMSPTGIQYVKNGETLIVTANPLEGYQVANVEMNGVEMPANAEGAYGLTITQDDTTVVGTFEVRPSVEPSLSLAVAHPLTDGSVSFGAIATGYGYTITDWGMIYSTDANRTTNVHTLSGNQAQLNDKGQFGVRLTFEELQGAYYMTPYVTFEKDDVSKTVYGTSILIEN